MNGGAESAVGTICADIRANILSARLPTRYWGAAFNYAVHTYDRTVHSATGKSPFEMRTGRNPNLPKGNHRQDRGGH